MLVKALTAGLVGIQVKGVMEVMGATPDLAPKLVKEARLGKAPKLVIPGLEPKPATQWKQLKPLTLR